MQTPEFPACEPQRLRALRDLSLLDTPEEERFDRLTRIAKQLFGIPIALVSLVDADRQWFKSRQGVDAYETGRDISFCGHAILEDTIFQVTDALLDSRFADNPLVTAAPFIRFYAGAPLKSKDGFCIGTLCIIGDKPRKLDAQEELILRDLADCVESEINRLELSLSEIGLRKQGQHTQAILDTMVDGLLTIDQYGTVQSVNRSAERIFGYAADEVIGHNINMLMPEPYRGQHDGYLHNYVSTNRAKIIGIGRTVVGLRKDGSTFPMDLSVGEMRVDGGLRMFTGIVRDVTDRQIIMAELNNFKMVLDNTLDMILMFTPKTLKFSYVNQGAVNSLGYSREELLGKMTPSDIKPKMPEPVYRSKVSPLLDGSADSVNFETVHRRKDGSEYPAEVVVQLIREGGVFVSIVRDITERKRIDRMKSEFISTVSHELRTPLTSIVGSLGLVASGMAGEIPAQGKVLVDLAHKNSKRLVELINDILDIEKIESGHMTFDLKPIALMPLLAQSIEVTKGYFEQHGNYCTLKVSVDVGVKVNVDEGRLLQVMANLLSNAAKFAPKGSQIEIGAKLRGEIVRVWVRDSGPGIPDEFRLRMFQKFSQADASDTRQKGGSGLGLSIVKAMLEHMNGTIDVDSVPGQGATFYFELPVLGANAAEYKATAQARRILVCEDDQDTAGFLQLLLQNAGYLVDVANGAEQARALLAEHSYNVMTLGLMFPGEEGLHFLNSLRRDPATHALPVVVVSSHAGKVKDEIEPGFVLLDCMEIPIDQARLLAAIGRAGVVGAGTLPRILHVEDEADIRQVVQTLVGDLAEIVPAASLVAARQQLEQGWFDLIILDMGLPDGNGADLLAYLENHNLATEVLVFSAQELTIDDTQRVAAALVKTRSSNEQLLETIKRLCRN